MKIKEILEYGKNNLIEKQEAYRLSKILLKHLLNVNNTYILINDDKELEKYKTNLDVGMPGKAIKIPITLMYNIEDMLNGSSLSSHTPIRVITDNIAIPTNESAIGCLYPK